MPDYTPPTPEAEAPDDLPWRTRALCAEAVERDLRGEVDRLRADNAALRAVADAASAYRSTERRVGRGSVANPIRLDLALAALDADRG